LIAGSMRNWAGNHAYRARSIAQPRSIDELQEFVRSATAVRALGTRHSFNDIADTDGDLVSLEGLPRNVAVEARSATVRVEGHLRYGDLVPELDRTGFALANLASLPHISIAGGWSTGTHGSGDRQQVLASAVRALSVVRADGELVTLGAGDGSRPGDLAAAAVSLGAIGVIVGATLSVEPTYSVRQLVYEALSERAFAERFGEITPLADSVSFFSAWRDPGFNVWLKQRIPPVGEDELSHVPPDVFDARLATHDLHPIPGMSADASTPQGGIPGPWHARLPHFRMEFTPSAGDELQSEYLVDRRNLVDAYAALQSLRPAIGQLVQVGEIRTIAADELWMSPAHERESAAIHFTWRSDLPAVRELLPKIEAALAPFDPRPHWGKLFTMSPTAVLDAYPRRRDFVAFARSMDPTGKLSNDFLRTYVLGEGAA
jgi:alditol oxidase